MQSIRLATNHSMRFYMMTFKKYKNTKPNVPGYNIVREPGARLDTTSTGCVPK